MTSLKIVQFQLFMHRIVCHEECEKVSPKHFSQKADVTPLGGEIEILG